MKKKSSALLGVMLPTALLLAACGSGGTGSSDADSGPRVAASFYPFAYVVEQVGGTAVDVENLTSPGTEPHDLELKPRQVADVQDADLVVYETGFQAAVDEAVEQGDLSEDQRLDVADVVTLLDASEDGAESDGHDHAEGEEHSHDEEGHDHGSTDPHVWLDPANMAKITDAVVERLSDIDPDQAATFEKNGTAFKARLTELDTSFRQGLAQCETRDIVTSHAAFGYLAKAYDLTQVPIAGIEPGNEPTAAQLADITRLVRQDGITTVFTEELASPAVADTVASETGATTATLSPIEGLTDDTADETY
ncbi:metal ABC transporter substrate-binding protein, partial [Solicola sp. PLA-1-18]|uniref:metal ABC transporter substrate-binding protein n=1 Tax=Solicola sp. PLA-1-18 TaxID=3380532 RepID=UPI003B80300B